MRAMNSTVTFGTGEHKVICLHGWFGSSGAWGPFVDSLDGARFTYAFMDYRGYGARKGVAGEHTIGEIAADTLALADELGWKSFSLVGHSMGGMAIQHVAADAPDRVRKVVGITPVPASGVPFDDATWGFFSSAKEARAARYGIIDLTTGKRHTARWIDQLVDHSFEHSTQDAFGKYLTAWAKTNFADRVQGSTKPFLVIVGEHDAAITTDVANATHLAFYPNAKLEIFSNAGHYPMFETPVALATSVERFLAD